MYRGVIGPNCTLATSTVAKWLHCAWLQKCVNEFATSTLQTFWHEPTMHWRSSGSYLTITSSYMYSVGVVWHAKKKFWPKVHPSITDLYPTLRMDVMSPHILCQVGLKCACCCQVAGKYVCDYKKAQLKGLHTCRGALWCHVYSHSGIKLRKMSSQTAT